MSRVNGYIFSIVIHMIFAPCIIVLRHELCREPVSVHKLSATRSCKRNYSLSHNYCEHHFWGIFQILLYPWSFLFHYKIPMPYGVARSKIILICSLFSQISMFEDFFADRILPCKLSESRRWIVIYFKEYFHVAGLLYTLCMQCLNC